MRPNMLIAALAALSLTSCVAVRSTSFDVASSRVGNGLHYAMPKGLFRIQLVRSGDDISLDVSEPIMLGDPNATYLLESSSGLLANQEYRFVVEPQTRLLSYVNSSSEGQAGQILVNLARSATYLGAGRPLRAGQPLRAGEREERVIYSRIVDPFLLPGCDFGAACDFGPVSEELRTAALRHCDAPDNAFNSDLCGRIGADQRFFRIGLEPLFESVRNTRASRRASPGACRRSICYRAAAPYSLSVSVGGVTDVSENVSLPNEAPVMSLSIPAGMFANSRARVELYQGMPARYVVDRDNELVAIALVPVDLVTAGFQAASEVIRFRIDYRSEHNADVASRGTAAPATPSPPLPPLTTENNYGDGGPRESVPADAAPGETPPQGTTPQLPWSDGTTAIIVNTQGSANPAGVLFSIPLSGSGVARSVAAPDANP